MSDPTASVTISARDESAAAFAQAEQRINSFGRTARASSRGLADFGVAAKSLRNVMAGFGLVLSARALGQWTAEALKSKNVTAEQKEVLDAASASMTRLNSVLQEQAVILAVKLAPAIEAAAEGWRRFLKPTDAEETADRIADLNQLINGAQQRIELLSRQGGSIGRDRQIEQQVREIAAYRSELDKLWEARKRQLSEPPVQKKGDGLEGFDLQAIGRQQIFQPRNFVGELQAMLAERTVKLQEAADKESQQRREILERELEDVRQGTLTREQAEVEAIGRRLEILRTSHEQGLIDQQRFYELSAEVARYGQERLTAIEMEGLTERERFERMSSKRKAQTFLGDLTQITAGVAQHNKKMFQLNKLLAYANAVVNTAEAISKAWTYGPILGPIYAAIAAAAGAAQISAIRATSFEGGGAGSTPTSVGSVPTINDEPVVPNLSRDPRRDGDVYNINITGGVIDRDVAVAIEEQIRRIKREKDV